MFIQENLLNIVLIEREIGQFDFDQIKTLANARFFMRIHMLCSHTPVRRDITLVTDERSFFQLLKKRIVDIELNER